MTYTIVGVTGHIDHGKTTLVGTLTGVDTDTHPEEKRRGITIDLGFASFQVGQHRFALIDAPGHQRYIGNLLAGVSAIDLGLLVVASDQGIQQQTLEHAAVVKALGVRKLIVAISRIDLVDESAIAELTEELEVFLADFGFETIPVVPISCVTGAGIEQLKSLMCDFAAQHESRTASCVASASADFRLPVDRVFTVPGRGLVAAGTVWSGRVRVGDMLELVGTTETLRVRELEVHGEFVESSQAGTRTAINLVGSGNVHIRRGDELVTPGTHPLSQVWVVALEMFPEAAEIRCPATVQMHSGTQSCAARVLGVKKLSRGDRTIVVVQPERSLVATYMQACLFRLPYPVGSFAGGRVLAAMQRSSASTKQLIALGQKLDRADPTARLLAWVEFKGEMQLDPGWCAAQLGIIGSELEGLRQSLVAAGSVLEIGPRLVSHAAAQRAKQFIVKLAAQNTQKAEDVWRVEASLTRKAVSVGSSDLIRWAVEQLIAENQLVRLNEMVAIASAQTELSKKQRAHLEQIIALFAATRSPPTLKELAEQLSLTLETVTSLVRFATQQRVLIDLGQGFLIATQVFGELCRELRALLESEPHLSVAAIRDAWQVTRKHAIPLLEYCDRSAITIRRENLRIAGPQLDRYCNQDALAEEAIEQF